MVKFTEEKKDIDLINAIVDRMLKIDPNIDRLSLLMDLSATHANGNKLDLEGLLNSKIFSFLHDIKGINQNLDRDTGELKNSFLPRYTCKLTK